MSFCFWKIKERSQNRSHCQTCPGFPREYSGAQAYLASELPRALLNTGRGPHPKCDLVGLAWAGKRACLTSPGDADAVGPGTTL